MYLANIFIILKLINYEFNDDRLTVQNNFCTLKQLKNFKLPRKLKTLIDMTIF